MSSSDLEPLPPDLERLLEAERSRPDPPSDMRSRVLERIGNDLLDTVPPPSGAGGPPGAGATSAAPPASSLASLALRRIPLAVTMLAVGAVGGVAVQRALDRQAPPAVSAPVAVVPATATAEPAPSPPSAPPTTATSEVAPPPRAERRRRVPPPLAPPPSPPPAEAAVQRERDAALAAERALLEQARTALARGKPGDALGILYRHERDFARGQLVEEREALEILALAADRQADAARARAAVFRRTYPSSMLQPAIDDALAPPPR